MKRRTTLGGALAASLLLSTAVPASAQSQGFAINRFDPSERGSDWFVLESLDLRGNLRPAAGIVTEYAYRPLVIYNGDGSVRASLVKDSIVVHPGASLVLWNRLRVGFDLPVYAFQYGRAGALAGAAYAPPSENVGDLRLGADLRLYGQYEDPFTLAAGVQVYLPTGSRSDYTGDGVTRVEPRILAAGRAGVFVYAAKLAFDYRALTDTFAGTGLGSDFLFAASAGVKTWEDRLVLGAEAFGSTIVTSSDGAFKAANTPLELLFGGHATVAKDWRFGAGIGPGLTRAFGEPAFRALLSAEWAPAFEKPQPPPPPPPPPEPPPPPSPPPPDRDGDGIIDSEDACPDDAGPKTDDPATNGCPDRDHDSVPDKVDACPDVPGVKTNDPKTNGCPPDRDGDGIVDDQDACPDVPGLPNEDPKKNGCPLAQIVGKEVKIRDQVKFRFDKAELDPASDPILEAVAAILNEHTEIRRVEIEGHTDNKGSAGYNLALSGRRAESVLKWLLAHGIDKKRLESHGYGLTRPIDDNATEDGRRNNRRVEFHIIDAGTPAAPK
jgi:outer membrane protein OmpA-like peptidoglycan-associated protein